MNGELLRLIDTICRDKGINGEVIFEGIESALLSAAQNHYPKSEELEVKINRESGEIIAHDKNGPIEPTVLGRIAAQAAKQVIIQKIKEAEGDVLYAELETKQNDIVPGTVIRFEYGNLVVNLGKTEAVIPRSEQVPGESYRIGERIKALVLSVRKVGSRVVTNLSRTHPEFVRRLFELEVPEIVDKTVEIKDIVREAGFRTKIAVSSNNPKVDAVGACVGVRGSRIKNIVEELYGEKIDIIKWDPDPAAMIKNSMKPATVISVEMFPEDKKATILVRSDQLSLAIGKKGQNIRLAGKLTDWDINVTSPEPERTADSEAPEEEAESEPVSNDETQEEPLQESEETAVSNASEEETLSEPDAAEGEASETEEETETEETGPEVATEEQKKEEVQSEEGDKSKNEGV